MKFFGNGLVWDIDKNKVLCKFENGEFEIEDTRVINKLIDLKYEHEGVVEDALQQEENEKTEEIVEYKIDYSEKTNAELKKILESKGYKDLQRKNKKQLLELIEGD